MNVSIKIIGIGNSKGVILPKPLLAQVGLADEACAELSVENGAIVLRAPTRNARSGWATAAKAVAANGDDTLVMGEFRNEDDAELTW